MEGTVTSDHSITYFEGVVYDSAHNAYMAASCAPNSYSVNIYSSNVNLSLPFRTLKTGSYYLVYNAVDSSGATASWNSGWFRVAGGSDLPSQPTVTTAQSSYNYGDSVRITWNAVAGNSFYWINVYKDGSLIVNQDMGQDTAYTLQNAGVGSYTVYVSANNSAGSSGSGSCTFRVTSQNDTITINNYNYPTDMTIGDSFSVKGVVKSTFSNISSLTVAVYSSDGSMEIGTNYAPNTASADISSIAGKLNFAKLSIGTHYYRITATNATQTQQLVNREFQVKYKIVSTDSDELRLRDFANLLSSYYQSDYFKNYSIDGSFQSNNSLITEVGVELFDQNGNLLQSAKDYPLVNYYRLNNLGSNALRPERLAIGTYKYNVYAVNAKGQKAQKSREIKVLPIPETIPYIETNTDVIELDTKYNCVFELECFARGVDYSWDYSLWADPLLIGSPLSEVQWAHTEQGCRLRVSAWNKKAGEGVVLARLYDRKEEAVIAVRYIKTITHEYEETVISPTCTTEGYTLLRCTACGKEEKINFVEALGHDWETNSVVTPPTCTESGYTTFTCANCGGSYVDDYVDPLGHAFDAWEQTLAPTCTTYGIEESRCSRCNLAVEREIDLLGHDWSAPVYAWSADCLQVTACRTCKRDATHIEAETVNTTSEITKPATETAEGEITYTAVFENPAFATQTKTVAIPKLEPQSHPADEYPDVEQGSWYYAAADYIISAGYMGSTSQTEKTFEPYTKVSRAMVASILYRMAGSPEGVEYSGAFTDVPKDQWYATAVEWCAQNALASGKGNGIFDPNGDVTRQELAVFMKKMSDYLNWKLTDTVELTDFPDSGTVQSWAEPYLQWAVAAKLITGKGQENGTVLLAPEATAMRCELASILQRFLALEPEVVEPPATEGDFSQRLIGFLDEAGYKEQSYAVSPLSLRAALALAASGATGETKEQLLKAMGFSSQEELEAWYQTVLANEKAFEDYFNSPEIEDRGDAAYRVVNSAWRNEAAEGDYLEDYLHLIQTTFGADAFSAPAAGLADKINAWVKEQTEGMIPQIVGDGVENMAAVLVNALYLKAGWDGEFAETEPLDFTCADGSTVKKDAIQTTDNLSYYADETTRMAVIPLRGGIRMAVVLGEGGDLGELLAAVEYKKVRLTMPKLDLETGFEKGELCDFLKVQGCEKIFTPEAELDAMFTTALYLSDIVQKVKVKTDEKGLEAAAATAAIFAESAAPDPEDPIDLTLDKTFTFYVFNGATAAPEILFFGRVAD